MYHVPEQAYTKAHLCDLKLLWIDAALDTIAELGPATAHQPEQGEGFDGNVVEIPQGGEQVVAPRAVTLDDLAAQLRRDKGTLETRLSIPGSSSLLVEKQQLGKTRIQFAKQPFRAMLSELGMDSFSKYQYRLAAAISVFYQDHPWAQVMEKMKNRFILALNGREWSPIISPIAAPGGAKYRVELTPVNEHFHGTFAIHGKSGFASMSPRLTISQDKVEQERATNLWHSRFVAEGHGDELLFECFRSGTLAFPFRESAEVRERIARAKAKELLTAMLIRHLQKLPDGERDAALSGAQPARVRAVCINVQSAAGRGFEDVKEKESVHDHVGALSWFSGRDEVFTLSWPRPRNVPATFDIAIFNFGVNAAGSVILSSKITFGGKAFRARTNEDGMSVLEEFHAAWKRETTSDRELDDEKGVVEDTNRVDEALKKERLVDELLEQIRPGVKGGGDTSYKTVALITNIGHLMNCQVHFNCKSGKDRTSVAALESHFLAWKIRETGRLPEWQNKLAGDDKLMHRRLVFESGNLELQRHNTGIPGYKIVPDMPVIKKISKDLAHVFELDLAARFGKHLVPAQGLCRQTAVDSSYARGKYKEFTDEKKMTPEKALGYARRIARAR